jgi:uncharacterized integral membrane protein
MSKFKKIILIILLILLIVIIVQNTEKLSFRVLFWSIDFPKYVLPVIIILCVAAGYLLAGLSRSGSKKKE